MIIRSVVLAEDSPRCCIHAASVNPRAVPLSIDESAIVCSVADGVSSFLQSSINTEYIVTLESARKRGVSGQDVMETITSGVKRKARHPGPVLHPGTAARMAKNHARFFTPRLLLAHNDSDTNSQGTAA